MASERIDWKSWLPIWLAVLIAAVTAVLWVTSALGDKAEAEDVREAQADIIRLEREAAIERTKGAWRDATLYEIAKRVGAVVPAPPLP